MHRKLNSTDQQQRRGAEGAAGKDAQHADSEGVGRRANVRLGERQQEAGQQDKDDAEEGAGREIALLRHFFYVNESISSGSGQRE